MNTSFIRFTHFASRLFFRATGLLTASLLFPCSRRLCAATVTTAAGQEPPSPTPLPSS